ncbi:MAG TPA: mevalonate kinase [Bacillota bacterium]|nr:mevalonate kinase [Bacillota bacterium]
MNAEKHPISEKVAIGKANSKLILVGEHAVVHGQPAIAIPFPLIGAESVVEYVPGAVKIDSEFYHGPIESAPKSIQGIASCIKATLDALDLPCQDLLISISSSIPPGKGLGSSASVAIAVIKSLFEYAGVEYTKEEVLRLANISETHAHGSPSGIDPLTITSNSPVWFEREKPIDYIKPNGDFYFIVADTGRMADTRSAIESVTSLLKKAPRKIQRNIERIGEITHQVRQALEKASKQLLGQLLNEAQKELEALGVSDAGLNRLIYYALQEGALGAKLTGGGNGGCIVALARNEAHSQQLSEKLKHFGAQSVWPFVLKNNDLND